MISATILCASLFGVADVVTSATGETSESAPEFAFQDRGAPTVVFETGLGFGMEYWAGIVSRLGNVSTFAYNRPGYGTSPRSSIDADGSRTGAELAPMLYERLEDAGAKPPYILVGHSIGALYALTFARQYPQRVQGIVLVDGRPKHYRAYCLALEFARCGPQSGDDWSAHLVAEARGAEATETEAPELEQLSPIPISVIIATDVPEVENGQAFRDLWTKVQQRAVDAAPNARLVVAPSSGHMLHVDRPDIVLREIESMISLTRDSESPAGRTTTSAYSSDN